LGTDDEPHNGVHRRSHNTAAIHHFPSDHTSKETDARKIIALYCIVGTDNINGCGNHNASGTKGKGYPQKLGLNGCSSTSMKLTIFQSLIHPIKQVMTVNQNGWLQQIHDLTHQRCGQAETRDGVSNNGENVQFLNLGHGAKSGSRVEPARTPNFGAKPWLCLLDSVCELACTIKMTAAPFCLSCVGSLDNFEGGLWCPIVVNGYTKLLQQNLVGTINT
jgi:hypothetical protein